MVYYTMKMIGSEIQPMHIIYILGGKYELSIVYNMNKIIRLGIKNLTSPLNPNISCPDSSY
jgi:hypothetical protein